MKELREQFLEKLKFQPQENNIINNTFAENIKEYLLLKDGINSTNNVTINGQRQCIENVLQYFNSHKLNANNIVYWDRSKIDENGKLYIDGNLVDENLYPQVCDIFILNQSIKNVFEAECKLSRLDDLTIDFKNTIKGNRKGGYQESQGTENASVKIYEQTLYKDLSSDNQTLRIEACKNIFKTLFHEIQHHRQHLLTQCKISNKDALLYAKEFSLKDILEDSFSSPTKENGNYNELATENNAQYVGASQYSNVMNDKDSKILDEMEFYKAYLSESTFYIDIQTKDNQKHFKYDGTQEKKDIATTILDEVITPEYIDKYPILQKEYNRDGTKKDTVQLIDGLLSEINAINAVNVISKEHKDVLKQDTNEMYYELICRELQKSTTSINRAIDKFGTSTISNLINSIINYNLKEKDHRIANCKVLSQEKYLDDENPEEVFEEDSNYLNEYYDNKFKLLSKLKEEIEKNKISQKERE